MGNILGTPTAPTAPAAPGKAASPANAAPVTHPQSPKTPTTPAVPTSPQAPRAPSTPPPVSNPATAQIPSNPNYPTAPSQPTAPAVPSGSGTHLGGYRRTRRRRKRKNTRRKKKRKNTRRKKKRKNTRRKQRGGNKSHYKKREMGPFDQYDFTLGELLKIKSGERTRTGFVSSIQPRGLQLSRRWRDGTYEGLQFYDYDKITSIRRARKKNNPQEGAGRFKRTRRGGWFGKNWFGTWGQKTKKGPFGFGWTSKNMKCNPYLPFQCPGGGRCVGTGWGIGPIKLQGKCI